MWVSCNEWFIILHLCKYSKHNQLFFISLFSNRFSWKLEQIKGVRLRFTLLWFQIGITTAWQCHLPHTRSIQYHSSYREWTPHRFKFLHSVGISLALCVLCAIYSQPHIQTCIECDFTSFLHFIFFLAHSKKKSKLTFNNKTLITSSISIEYNNSVLKH